MQGAGAGCRLPAPAPSALVPHVEQHAGPVGAVGDEAQVGERALGRADLALDLAELVGEGDEELAVALRVCVWCWGGGVCEG